MTRLNELQNPALSGAPVRWDPSSVDVLSAVENAHRMRDRYVAAVLSRGFKIFARLSGLTALFAALAREIQRRHTQHELSHLSERELRDVGLERSQINAIAAEATASKASHRSVWHMLANWIRREAQRRRTVSELSAMPDHMLLDIGVERADIGRVAAALADRETVDSRATKPSVKETSSPRTAAALAVMNIRAGVTAESNDNQPAAANQNRSHPSAA